MKDKKEDYDKFFNKIKNIFGELIDFNQIEQSEEYKNFSAEEKDMINNFRNPTPELINLFFPDMQNYFNEFIQKVISEIELKTKVSEKYKAIIANRILIINQFLNKYPGEIAINLFLNENTKLKNEIESEIEKMEFKILNLEEELYEMTDKFGISVFKQMMEMTEEIKEEELKRRGFNNFDKFFYSQAMVIHMTTTQMTINVKEFEMKEILLKSKYNIMDMKNYVEKIVSKYTLIEKQVEKLIKCGEGDYIEFKETFSVDIKGKMPEKEIQHECLKTIAAFLNTNGGHLFIGISDKEEIKGLERDYEISSNRKDKDGFQQKLINSIKSKIGIDEMQYIKIDIVKYKEKDICIVKVLKSEKPAFIGNDEFYIRTGNTSQKLTNKETANYVRNIY